MGATHDALRRLFPRAWIFLGNLQRQEVFPWVVEVPRSHLEQGLGPFHSPVPPRMLPPVRDQGTADSGGNATADRITGRKVLAVAHRIPVVAQVLERRRQHLRREPLSFPWVRRWRKPPMT